MVTCLKCAAPVAHRLGVAEHEAAGAALCVEHLAALLRQRARYRCSRPDCDRRLFLAPDRECSWCQLGRPVTEDITTLKHPVSILRGAAYLAAKKVALQEVEESELENPEDESEEVE